VLKHPACLEDGLQIQLGQDYRLDNIRAQINGAEDYRNRSVNRAACE